jgi:hypothetical protein
LPGGDAQSEQVAAIDKTAAIAAILFIFMVSGG